jgi:nitrite reductase/ring-hydroxylating ferredoxin subunit
VGEGAVNLVRIATWADVPDGQPTEASTEGVDLVIIRRGDTHSVFHGRCLHRGALLADGEIRGDDLICGLHGWDLSHLSLDDLTTFDRDMADLTGIEYGGVR